MYDPALGRFFTQDRFTEKYIDFSPYQYAANNPACNIDVNGDSIWFTPYYNENNELTAVTMHVTGKVINTSSKNVDMKVFLLFRLVSFHLIYRGYIATYNTYVYISYGSNIVYDSVDFIIMIDNQEILQDTLSNTADWHLGKIYLVKLVPGYHNTLVNKNHQALMFPE